MYLKFHDTEKRVMSTTSEASRDLGTAILPAGAVEQTSQRSELSLGGSLALAKL